MKQGGIPTKNCILYGNCHVPEIRKHLMSSREFNESYRFLDMPPVYLCDKEKGLDEPYIQSLRTCDLFVYQKVNDSYSPLLSTDFLIHLLPDSCLRLCIANSYFTGYHPQYDPGGINPYTDRNIIGLINKGLNTAEIIRVVSDESFYSASYVMTNLTATLDELKRRDREVDIPIADFIERNYKNTLLFFTVNHPAPLVIRYITMQILSRLGLHPEHISQIIPDSTFTNQIHPIYPSVIKHLDLTFLNRNEKLYTINSSPLTFEQYIERHADIVRAHANC